VQDIVPRISDRSSNLVSVGDLISCRLVKTGSYKVGEQTQYEANHYPASSTDVKIYLHPFKTKYRIVILKSEYMHFWKQSSKMKIDLSGRGVRKP
jgi:hypothetical protein